MVTLALRLIPRPLTAPVYDVTNTDAELKRASLTGVFSATFKRGLSPIRTRKWSEKRLCDVCLPVCVARATQRSMSSCFVWQRQHSGPCLPVLCGKGNTAVPVFLFCVAKATQRSLPYCFVRQGQHSGPCLPVLCGKGNTAVPAFLFCVAKATQRSLSSCFVWQGQHSGPCLPVLCGKGNTAVSASC